MYQPSDAELSKTKSKAVEQISAQVGPILDLIVSVPCRAVLCVLYVLQLQLTVLAECAEAAQESTLRGAAHRRAR